MKELEHKDGPRIAITRKYKLFGQVLFNAIVIRLFNKETFVPTETFF